MTGYSEASPQRGEDAGVPVPVPLPLPAPQQAPAPRPARIPPVRCMLTLLEIWVMGWNFAMPQPRGALLIISPSPLAAEDVRHLFVVWMSGRTNLMRSAKTLYEHRRGPS